MKLIDFINEYDDWQERLAEPPYCVKVSQDGEYFLLKYNQIESDFNEPIVQECRGCIVKQDVEGGRWIFVCKALSKFGNYGESYCPNLNWHDVSVQEKVDGSLIKIWHDKGWHISTNGTIDAFKAETGSVLYPTYGALVLEALKCYFDDYHEEFFGHLDQHCTYWFELVSPYTRVVIPYEDIELYFLGWRDMCDGKELDPMDCALCRYFPTPKRYELNSLDDVKNAAAALPWDEEGYVCCDNHFNRVKVKSPDYVKAHYARTHNTITMERLISVVLEGEEEEFLTYCQDYAEALADVKQKMTDVAAVASGIANYAKTIASMERKAYAELALKNRRYSGFMFAYYDAYHRGNDDYGWASYVDGWTAQKWEKFLRDNKTNAFCSLGLPQKP